MAVPRLRVPTAPGASASLRQAAGLGSDEGELYHRTDTTLLRSSGETLLRVLEPPPPSMSSSPHRPAAPPEPDRGAFLSATGRLPASVGRARVVVMGQETDVFARHGIGPIEQWTRLEAPARRRRWYADE